MSQLNGQARIMAGFGENSYRSPGAYSRGIGVINCAKQTQLSAFLAKKQGVIEKQTQFIIPVFL